MDYETFTGESLETADKPTTLTETKDPSAGDYAYYTPLQKQPVCLFRTVQTPEEKAKSF